VSRVLGTYRPSFLLRDFAVALVQQRIGVYADEILRQITAEGQDVERPARPRTFRARETPMRLPSEQVPAIIIAAPGNRSADLRDGDGTYRATYPLEVHAIVEATDEDVGYRLASILALASVAVLLDGLGGGLAGHVGKPTWLGEGYAEGSFGERTRYGSVHLLDVPYSPISESLSLPDDWTDPPIGEPPTDPGDLPTVETVGGTTIPVKEIA
jgi:hypothetical protein